MKMGDWDSVEVNDTSHLVPKFKIETVCGTDITHERFHYTNRTVIDCEVCRTKANQSILVGPALVLETANHIDNMIRGN